MGAWGENLAEKQLRLRGFTEVHAIKTGSNQGVDRIAVKRNAAGEIIDVRFVEVKTGQSRTVKLGVTKHSGRQMSRKWLADRLKAAYRSESTKQLAQEIRQFAKSTKQPLTSLGEIIQVDPSRGEVRRLAADGKTLLSSQSLKRLLNDIQRWSTSRETHRWANRQLTALNQIRSTRMSSWISRATPDAESTRLASRSIRVSAGSQRGTAMLVKRGVPTRRGLAKAGGRVVVVVAIALNAKELFDTEYAYRHGKLSRRDRNIRHSTSAGGIAGAWAGGTAGSAAGATVGLVGGPFAWITVPAGAAIGGAVGGVGGYFAGSAVANYAASAWYDSIDREIRDRAELRLIAAPFAQ